MAAFKGGDDKTVNIRGPVVGLLHCLLVFDSSDFVPGCQLVADVLSVSARRPDFLRAVSQYSALGRLAACC